MRALILAVLALTVLAAGMAVAQTNETETNTTTTVTTYTIVIANVTPVQGPNVEVKPFYTGPGELRIVMTCTYVAGATCPNVSLAVGWNGTVYYNSTLEFTQCSLGVCRGEVHVSNITNTSWVWWSYDGKEYNTTVRYVQPPPGPAEYVVSMLPLAVVAGLLFRGGRKAAGLGGLVSGLVVYMGNSVGLWNYNPLLVSLSIIAGVVLLWLS